MKKVMDFYCEQEKVRVSVMQVKKESVRFYYEGHRLCDGETTDEVGLESGSEIDVMGEQTGGGFQA